MRELDASSRHEKCPLAPDDDSNEFDDNHNTISVYVDGLLACRGAIPNSLEDRGVVADVGVAVDRVDPSLDEVDVQQGDLRAITDRGRQTVISLAYPDGKRVIIDDLRRAPA